MQFLVTSDTLGKNIQGLSKMMNGKASLAILDHYFSRWMATSSKSSPPMART